MRSRNPSKRSYRPSTTVSDSPPVTLRSWVGIFTLTDIGARNITSGDRGQFSLERLHARLDLVGLEAAAHGVERLQPLAGDRQHHPLARADLAALGQLGQHRGGHAAGRLGEDAR